MPEPLPPAPTEPAQRHGTSKSKKVKYIILPPGTRPIKEIKK